MGPQTRFVQCPEGELQKRKEARFGEPAVRWRVAGSVPVDLGPTAPQVARKGQSAGGVPLKPPEKGDLRKRDTAYLVLLV